MANRLQFEDSPYLQQHKENPVEWYPWCEEAFERAKREKKAIFISIGYSSCHWCHVMEHEVFEDTTIASFLNDHFISIKVDREERPDIDKHYQEVHQLLNRRPGGWPTSIFCTPENKPFYAGTYIPPASRDQMLGFTELTKIIADKIASHDEQLFKNADEIQGYLKLGERPKQATVINDKVTANFIKQVQHNYEPAYGGFTVSPKFPHASTLNALLNINQIQPDDNLKTMITHTLGNMQAGGIYDLIDGGFCRYSVDTEWLVPHFEKMTYDNGLLCELYTRAYRFLGDEGYLHTAKEIAGFMQAFMMENDLFYSASDADSEGEEGKYFVYSYDEVITVLKQTGSSDDEAKRRAMRLCVSKGGNFEGRNIIRFADIKREPWFDDIRPHLAALREERPYPFIDRKVQTSWNAMMIKALFELSRFEAAYKEQAVRSLDALMTKMQPAGKLYHSALVDKEPKVEAFLEDYAYLGTALIAAYEATHDDSYLIMAQQQANTALETFYDKGRWFFSTGEFVTEADASDSSYPGAVGVMVDLMTSLGSLVEEKYRHFAFKTIEYYSYKLAKTPIYF
ncbi:MAG: thioredoxin domain-containing protein, partial [Sulfurimonadaceae bacterium]|nr:thioredoxin domain-containing protein [Sulfurimonadaceae bacterium]